MNNNKIIYDLAIGSAQKGINKNKFLSIKIKIPKNNNLIDNLEILFNKVELLQNEIKENYIIYKQYIEEL